MTRKTVTIDEETHELLVWLKEHTGQSIQYMVDKWTVEQARERKRQIEEQLKRQEGSNR